MTTPTQSRRPVVRRAVTNVADSAEVVETTSGSDVALTMPPEPGDEKVTVIVPKDYTLTLDDGSPIKVHAGVQEMHKSYVDHWFSKAMGVTVYAAG